MARKKKHEEHVNHERWLVSYADFITLLFAFFVVMYSISSVNDGKYRVLSDSLTSAFRQSPHSSTPIQVGEGTSVSQGDLPTAGSQSLIPLPIPTPDAPKPDDSKSDASNTDIDAKAEEKSQQESAGAKLKPMDVPTFADPKMGEIADKITVAMTGLIKDDLITVRRDERWLEVEIKSSILFPSGSARLTPTALPMLKELANIVAPFPNPIHVEGFTDNIPIHTIAFLSNWELSASRAASVVHLFMQSGVAPERMAAIGYGEFKASGDNATAEGRAKNRRVVLVIMPGEDPRWARAPNELPNAGTAAKPASAPNTTGAPADPIAPATAQKPAAATTTSDPFINATTPPPQASGKGAPPP
jgi:chemotaxis protein MotB